MKKHFTDLGVKLLGALVNSKTNSPLKDYAENKMLSPYFEDDNINSNFRRKKSNSPKKVKRKRKYEKHNMKLFRASNASTSSKRPRVIHSAFETKRSKH